MASKVGALCYRSTVYSSRSANRGLVGSHIRHKTAALAIAAPRAVWRVYPRI